MYKRIFINQCGYLPYMEKLVTFNSTGIDKPVSFNVLKSDGASVYSGTAAKRADNPSANGAWQILYHCRRIWRIRYI